MNKYNWEFNTRNLNFYKLIILNIVFNNLKEGKNVNFYIWIEFKIKCELAKLEDTIIIKGDFGMNNIERLIKFNTTKELYPYWQ